MSSFKGKKSLGRPLLFCAFLFAVAGAVRSAGPSLKRALASCLVVLPLGSQPAFADAAVVAPFAINNYLASNADEQTPSDADNNLVRMAFADFDAKRFDSAEKEFSMALKRWEELKRPRDERVSILKGRANVLIDNKKFDQAIDDLNKAIILMDDGEKVDGTARYPEFPDTFVNRGLAKEGLSQWEGAISDYTKAINLWGGGRGKGINPFVLTFKGNALSKLGRYEEALAEYSAASDLFLQERDVERFADARANYALALYGLDRRDEAVKEMKLVLRKFSGSSDMHVALAADEWDRGEYIAAIKNFNTACDGISSGCEKYKDREWVSVVRRWPPNLVAKLEVFLDKKVSPELLDKSQSLKLQQNL
jgi:tetratricopeptide (TPR) repeat protein